MQETLPKVKKSKTYIQNKKKGCKNLEVGDDNDRRRS